MFRNYNNKWISPLRNPGIRNRGDRIWGYPLLGSHISLSAVVRKADNRPEDKLPLFRYLLRCRWSWKGLSEIQVEKCRFESRICDRFLWHAQRLEGSGDQIRKRDAGFLPGSTRCCDGRESSWFMAKDLLRCNRITGVVVDCIWSVPVLTQENSDPGLGDYKID